MDLTMESRPTATSCSSKVTWSWAAQPPVRGRALV